MQVPFFDLKQQYARIRGQILPAVEALLDSQDCCNGQSVRELERRIADYSNCRFALGVSNGTDALLCGLMALGIGPGDEVITTPFTFFATAGSIWRAGARPVFVDIEADTFNIDPSRIEAAVTPRTKAIMPVHLYGQTAEMDAILAIARRHGLHVIEDAAQAIGATYKGRKAGSMGTIGCLSFYPTKNLGGIGDGGMILTQDEELSRRLAAFRIHGMEKQYYHKWVGGNFRMDSIQAVALLIKLQYLEQWSARRRENARRYDQAFAGLAGVATPRVRPENVSIYHQYIIRARRRDELQAFLKQQGVGSSIFYPLCLHQQECFASLGYRAGDFPQAEKAAAEVLALPIFPELTDEQVDYAAAKVGEFCG